MTRQPTPSLKILIDEEAKYGEALKVLLHQFHELDLHNTNCLFEFHSELLQSAQIFSMASRSLVDYYTRHGATTEAMSTRRKRYTLVHQEVVEITKLLNGVLNAQGYDALSDVESVSHPSHLSVRSRSPGGDANTTEPARRLEAKIPNPSFPPRPSPEAKIPEPPRDSEETREASVWSVPIKARSQTDWTGPVTNQRLGKTLTFNSPIQTSTPFNPEAPPFEVGLTDDPTPTFRTSNPSFPFFPNFSSLDQPMSSLRISGSKSLTNQPPSGGLSPAAHSHSQAPPQLPSASDPGGPYFDQKSPKEEPVDPTELPLGASAFSQTSNLPPTSYSPPPHGPQEVHRDNVPSQTQFGSQAPPQATVYVPPTPFSMSPHPYPPQPTHHPPSTFPQPTPYPYPQAHHPDTQRDKDLFQRLRSDLKRGSSDPYKGDPLFFHQWKVLLVRRIEEARLEDPLDQVQVIIAHLSGKLQESAKMMLAAGIDNPAATLQALWQFLNFKEGKGMVKAIEDQIKNLAFLKDPIQAESLDEYIQACRLALSSMRSNRDLMYLDTPVGIVPILDKLPGRLRHKWTERSTRYEQVNGVRPGLEYFIEFLHQESLHLNSPYFQPPKPQGGRARLKTFATKAVDSYESEDLKNPQAEISCYYHFSSDHKTPQCQEFGKLAYDQKRKIASDNRLCYNCLSSHYAANCPGGVLCKTCGGGHLTMMHWDAPHIGFSHRWGQPNNRWDRPKEHSSNGHWRAERSFTAGSGGPEYVEHYSTSKPNRGGGFRTHSSTPPRWKTHSYPPPSRWREGHSSSYPKVRGRGYGYSSGKPKDVNPTDQSQEPQVSSFKNTCTLVCGEQGKSRICSKTILVDITHRDTPGSMRGYCIVDEQSNASFCDQAVVDFFSPDTFAEDYRIITMNGIEKVQGISVPGMSVKGVHEIESHALPSLFMHPNIPDTTAEVATQEMVRAHPHIAALSNRFPKSVGDYPMLLLIGADCGSLMKSETIGSQAPYIHRTPLGYAVVGPVCPQSGEAGPLKAFRTNVQVSSSAPSCNLKRSFIPNYSKKELETPFETREDDEMKGYSQENLLFMDIISEGVTINEKGHIEMPLPMRPGAEVPNNRSSVLGRTISTLNRLKRDDKKLNSSLKAFGEYLTAGHVVEAPIPPSAPPDQVCYLPIFPVFNPHKDGARLVLDPSLATEGKSLNNALLSGPDETNKLVGVLIRFRVGEIGFSADVEKMFHAFYVCEEQRDLLRFFWFKNNCPTSPIIEYRSNVMVFGSKSSPSCATFGLRFAALSQFGEEFPASRHFLLNNMYIDDALGSADTVEEAIQVLQGSVSILNQYKIRLHKFNSSSTAVLEALPSSELAESVAALPTLSDSRTLGLVWRPQEDTLGIASNLLQRPFTKRGVLGIVHSTFDPLGLASPSLLQGKLIMREIMPQKGKNDPEEPQYDWDDPLPDRHRAAWDEWTSSLQDVCLIKLPRSYKPPGFGEVSRREIHCFCDASKDAIGFVLYLRSFNAKGEIALSFLYASSKVSPRAADTIPRLELCAAFDAVQTTSKVTKELSLRIDEKFFYSDSLVVLGYLNNTTKRFSRYVARRIEAILQLSSTKQWFYVSSSLNAGDIASRPHSPQQLIETCWLTGPLFLLQDVSPPPQVSLPVDLPEVSKEVSTLLTVSQLDGQRSLPDEVSKITNRWSKAVSLVGVYLQLSRILLKRDKYDPAELAERSEKVLIREAQHEFRPQIALIKDSKPLPKNDHLLPLSPLLDQDDILRVGGRLSYSDFPPDVKNPILLPSRHPITNMIIARHHLSVKHQGRILTLGALRQAGYHILSGSRVIKRFLADCVICRRIRGKPTEQMMAPLPKKRLETLAPFDHVGIDFFGPYLVHDGRNTRRSNATKKVWVMLVTCLASRACHVEVVPSMDTSSFELALRRFLALRGKITSIVSDQGSNFKGALNQSMDFSQFQKVAATHGIQWKLNPPLASNFGGVFERKIGAIKSVFNATLQLLGKRDLSRDEFTTFIIEATAIVNSTPLWEVSTSPDDPCPLSPARLLTLKDNPHPPPVDTFSPTDLLQYGKSRWRRVMYLADQFWMRWQRFYAAELQERRKWTTPNRNISVGDVVLLKGNAKRNQWPLGRITETTVGDDGLVRRVKVRVGKAGDRPPLTLERSVRDTILVLPNQS